MRIPDEKVKRILQLKYDVGLSVRVIAERLGVSERSIFYILKAAKQKAAAAANAAAQPPTTLPPTEDARVPQQVDR